jgi:hypothetical protein
MLSADGTPLKKSLQIALRRQKLRALALVAPLLLFVLISFIAPIADMLFRSVENEIVSETIPRTVIALEQWDYQDGNAAAPSDDVYAALYVDLSEAEEFKTHTRLGSRLNYETTGMSSLLRKTGRGIGRMDTDEYTKQFEALDPKWEDPAVWVAMMQSPGVADILPETASAWQSWQRIVANKNDVLAEEQPEDFIYTMLYRDLVAQPASAITAYSGAGAEMLQTADSAVDGFEVISLREQFLDIDEDWADPQIWGTIKAFSSPYTAGYFLSSVDLQLTPAGVEAQPENQQIYMLLSADDPGASALLDIASGANVGMEGDAATAGGGERHAGLAGSGRRRRPIDHDQQPVRHRRGDDPYPAAVHDPAALFGDADDPAHLSARRQIAGGEQLDGVLAGIFPAICAGHRRRLDPRLHPVHRILHHARTGRRHHRHVHLEPDRLSHLQLAELGAGRRAGCDPAGDRAGALLALRPDGGHRQREAGIAPEHRSTPHRVRCSGTTPSSSSAGRSSFSSSRRFSPSSR